MGMIYNPNTCRYEYMPDYYPQQQQQVKSPTTSNQGLLWVSGEVGAKSWVVPPNQTVLLMDSESNHFFIKSSDNAGMPTIKTYEYKEITPTQPAQTQTVEIDYSSDIQELRDKIAELNAKMEQMQEKKEVKKPAKKEVTENE